jgi:uncharacterized protein
VPDSADRPDRPDPNGTSGTTPRTQAVTPAVEGWFTTGESPALLGARCTACGTIWFPPLAGSCPNPGCGGGEVEPTYLSRQGTVWSYTDARYQPPPPYIPATEEHEPFGLAAVELPEGLTVLGQLAQGYGIDDVSVGSQVELVVEPLYADDSGVRLIWRWRPVTELGEESEQ